MSAFVANFAILTDVMDQICVLVAVQFYFVGQTFVKVMAA